MTRYSVAISPPDPAIEQVRQLKQQLRAAIGWYNSVNALAHITFNVFETDDADVLHRWEVYTAGFAAMQAPLSLLFNHTATFPNSGAFFLAPSETSDLLLTCMMKTFHQQSPMPADVASQTPHMSIGRRLTPLKLSHARALIPSADIRFLCNDLVLRRFNHARKQYDIYRRFAFGEGGVGENNT